MDLINWIGIILIVVGIVLLFARWIRHDSEPFMSRPLFVLTILLSMATSITVAFIQYDTGYAEGKGSYCWSDD